MDDQGINHMANRLAAEEVSDPNLEEVDQAIDAILTAIQVIEETLPKVAATTPEEEAAKKKIADTFETAINPYFADVLAAMEVFGGEDTPE